MADETSGGLPAFPNPELGGALRDPAQSAPSRIDIAFGLPLAQRRWTVLLRLILVIPHIVLLAVLAVLAGLLTICSWFAALFIGRLPRSLAPFLVGFQRWVIQVDAYLLLLTDRYPPFSLEDDADYPIRYAAHPGPLNRLAVFFRIILVLPAAIYASLLWSGLFLVSPIIWLIALITGRLPEPLFKAIAAVVRYYAREGGFFGLITSEWPWGSFGDTPPLEDSWPGVSRDLATTNGSPWDLYLGQASKVLLAIFLVLGIVLDVLRRR